MNTIESNRLIAEFMGAHSYNKRELFVPIHGICYHDTIELGRGKVLKYHKSWDWLMPVVEKCLIGEAESPERLISNIYENICTLSLNSTYNACIEFIEWYNLQSK